MFRHALLEVNKENRSIHSILNLFSMCIDIDSIDLIFRRRKQHQVSDGLRMVDIVPFTV